MSDPYQVLLYYLYTRIEDPELFAEHQRELCEGLSIRGRIIVAEEGINGAVSGEKASTEAYMDAMAESSRVCEMQFKVDPATGHVFEKLSVKVRTEIVSLHLSEVEDVAMREQTGERLMPEQFRAEIESGEIVLLDGRNKYESDLGRFKGAVCPQVEHFRDFPQWIRENLSDAKDKRILTYCTGGIRCEKLSGFLLKEGFKSVAQLDGGIVSYGKDSQAQGRDFEGQCYVFDQRIGIDVNSVNPTVASECRKCGVPCQRYLNCAWQPCNEQIFLCEDCEMELGRFCGESCSLAGNASLSD